MVQSNDINWTIFGVFFVIDIGQVFVPWGIFKNQLFQHSRILEEKYSTVPSWKNSCLFVVKSWNIAKRESSKRCCSLKAAVPRCLWKGLLKNFLKLVGKNLYQTLFYEVSGFNSATYLKKKAWRRCFPVNSTRILQTPFS